MIVLDDANQTLALRAVLFAAVGTAGQRCTTLRRLYLQEGIHDQVAVSCVRCRQLSVLVFEIAAQCIQVGEGRQSFRVRSV